MRRVKATHLAPTDTLASRRPAIEHASIIELYYTATEETCSQHPGCFTDGGAAAKLRVTDADIGAEGGLSIAGQAKLAALVWQAFPEEIKRRP